jgi:hypothetical protein
MVVLGATPSEKPLSWEEIDYFKSLGFTKEKYPFTSFNSVGPANEKGLTVVGDDAIFGRDTPIFKQDCSIMGWTAGFCSSNAHGIAQFYWDLMYNKTLVSQKSIDEMLILSNMTMEGYATLYGAGLFVNPMGTKVDFKWPYNLNKTGTYVGHGGETFGYISDQGFVPSLNASFSVIMNSNADSLSPSLTVGCPLIQMAYKYHGLDVDLGCIPMTPIKYVCGKFNDHEICRVNRNP